MFENVITQNDMLTMSTIFDMTDVTIYLHDVGRAGLRNRPTIGHGVWPRGFQGPAK